MLKSVTPFFIVEDLSATLEFYRSKLGFEVLHKGGGDGDGEDFWAMIARDQVTFFLKAITPEVHPHPNHTRHEWARRDAYVYTDDPDSLYRELVDRGAPIFQELSNERDGLRAFEIKDNNGYVLCFGRPLEN